VTGAQLTITLEALSAATPVVNTGSLY